MAKRILVAYTTNAGSTQEVAETIGETLSQDGVQADVRRIKDVGDVSTYDAVVVGGPMIRGWHRATLKFLRKRQRDLSQVPVAYFLTAMRLTKMPGTDLGTVSIYQDPALAKPPENESKPSFKERYATVGAKFGNTAYKELRAKGYRVIPVHPHADVIEGDPCYPSLSALPEAVDGVVIVFPPSETEKVVVDVAQAGIRRVWMQQGAESQAAIRFCEDRDISAVHGECILMFAGPAGRHRLHRWAWRILGKLPQ